MMYYEQLHGKDYILKIYNEDKMMTTKVPQNHHKQWMDDVERL